MVFRGLAAPGAPGLSQTDDLVAVWRTKGDQRFQNYRASFTILDVPEVKRGWLDGLREGSGSAAPPKTWRRWRDTGVYAPLLAPRTKAHRSPKEQLPVVTSDLRLLRQIVSRYEGREHDFERCAGELFRLMCGESVRSLDLTRRWRDGGRDALGVFAIGTSPSAIGVEFALEAKCKKPSPSNSSGVRETARLLARLRHRQFGVFVTTSCIGRQAYQELVEDAQPVVVMAGVDIVRVLKENGHGSEVALSGWLDGLDDLADGGPEQT